MNKEYPIKRKEDLLGKRYPLKGFDNSIIATRTIKAVADIENCAGYLISTISSSPEQWLLIGYIEAENCFNGKYDSVPEIEKESKD